jgi:hypothetical protein
MVTKKTQQKTVHKTQYAVNITSFFFFLENPIFPDVKDKLMNEYRDYFNMIV